MNKDFIKIKLEEALYSIQPQVEYNGRPFNRTYHMGHKWWLKWRDLAERKYKVTFEKSPDGRSIFVFEPDYESAIHILTYDINRGTMCL